MSKFNPMIALPLIECCNKSYLQSNDYCANNRGVEFSFLDSPLGQVLTIKGSVEVVDWMGDFNTRLTETPSGMVHSGFSIFADEILRVLEDVGKDVKGKVYLTGHSLGGALATIIAPFVDKLFGLHGCMTFGAPCVGDENLTKAIEEAVSVPIYRVVNKSDVVPRLLELFPNYEHVGIPVLISNGKIIEGRVPFYKALNVISGVTSHLPWSYERAIKQCLSEEDFRLFSSR